MLLVAGCSDPRREALRRLPLSELNLHYGNFGAIFGRGPKDAEELKRFAEGTTSNGQPGKLDPKILSGEIVVNWNGDPNDETQKDAVVAYEKQVPKEGGYVALNSGNTVKMSAAEFSKRPKLLPRKSDEKVSNHTKSVEK